MIKAEEYMSYQEAGEIIRTARAEADRIIAEAKKAFEAEKETAKLKKLLNRQLLRRTVVYVKSDRTKKVLSLKEVINRVRALEIAYNPNDCVEVRWGAPEESVEHSSCKRRAPVDQQEKMKSYREWFQERRRPVGQSD